MKMFKNFIAMTFNNSKYLENKAMEEIDKKLKKEQEDKEEQIKDTFIQLAHYQHNSNNLKALTNIIKNGFSLDDSDILMIVEKISFMLEYRKEQLDEEKQKDLTSLLSQILISSLKIESKNLEYSASNSSMACSYPIYILINSEKIKSIYHTLPVNEKLSILNKYKTSLERLKDVKHLLRPLFSGSEEFVKEAELSLDMGLEEVNIFLKNKNFSSNSIQEIEHIVKQSSSLTTPLGKTCFQLQEKILNIQKNYASIVDPEDSALFKKILEQDIPKLLHGSSLTIPEISQKYEELSGKSLSSSLEDIANKYIVLIQSLEEKYLSGVVETTSKAFKSQELYLDKKIEEMRLSVGKKTMSVKK